MKWAFFAFLMIIMIVTDKPTNYHATTHTYLYVRLGQLYVMVKWDTKS